MATFNTNYSELRLLSNKKISGWINGKEFEIVPPKLLDYNNHSFSFIADFLDKDIQEIEKLIVGMTIKSHYNMISIILSEVDKSENVKKMASLALSGLQVFLPDIHFENKMLKIKQEFLDEKTFNSLVILLFKMLGKEKIIINEDDDPFTKKEKEAKLRVQRIKRNKKGKGDKNSMEDMLASILYEFQQYTLKDLFELNIYTIYYLFGYVGKIANYEVSQIAAGNGNLKKGSKHKYFVEK